MRPPEEIKKILVQKWLAKADQDLNAGEALLSTDTPFLYPACFHAQQAVEKYLKAVLTWHQIEFPKTHIIEELLDLLQQVDSSMTMKLKIAAVLTPYGVEIRYPADEPEPGLKEAREALKLAQMVKEAVVNHLGNSL